MKKVILSMLALATLFVSCNDDDSNNAEEPKVLTIGKLDYTAGTKVDVSGWTWKDANLTDGATVTGNLTGNVTTDTTLDGVYTLNGSYFVKSGATLTIAAGAEIIADASGTSVYIAVEKGGKINIQGTAAEPVVMASTAGAAGDWGGLTICGEGVTSSGLTAVFEVGDLPYGGTNAADNSGSIEYLVIRGTGAQINTESQYNGISFCAVGSGTTVNHISVINGDDDGVEFYGGSVEASEVYIKDCSDDAVDWTESWDGGIENLYISHDNDGFSTAFEGDKANGNPTFENVTAVSTVGGTALQFKKASGASINNLVLEGYENEIEFKDADLFVIANVKIDGKVAVIKE